MSRPKCHVFFYKYWTPSDKKFDSFHRFQVESAQKYIRKTETRTLQNRQVKSRLKTLSKKVATAAESGDKAALAEASKDYISALDKAGKTGLVHANKIARHKARCANLASA